MTFSEKTLTVLVLIALGLSALSFLILLTMGPRGRLRQGDAATPDRHLTRALSQHTEAISRLHGAVEQLAGEDRRLADLLGGALQRVGLVRYDAFEDMGGHLSFSAALLDGNGNGLVITSINGRQDTRCYAKPVEGWTSRHNLSGEEEEAIQQALVSSGQPAPVQLAAGARTGRRGA